LQLESDLNKTGNLGKSGNWCRFGNSIGLRENCICWHRICGHQDSVW